MINKAKTLSQTTGKAAGNSYKMCYYRKTDVDA